MFNWDLAELTLLSFNEPLETFWVAVGMFEVSNPSSKPLKRLRIGPRVRPDGCETSGLTNSACCWDAAALASKAVEARNISTIYDESLLRLEPYSVRRQPAEAFSAR